MFTACAVHAMTRDESNSSVCESEKNKTIASAFMFSLSDFPLSVSQDDLKVEQKVDCSLLMRGRGILVFRKHMTGF